MNSRAMGPADGAISRTNFSSSEDESRSEREAEEFGVGGQRLLALDHQPLVVGATMTAWIVSFGFRVWKVTV